MFWTNFTLYAAEFKSNSFLERFPLFLLSDWCFPDSSSIWYFTSVCFCKPRQMCEQGFWSRLTFFLDKIVSHDENGFVGVFRMKIVFSKYQLERIQERCSTMGRSFTDGWNFRVFSNWTLFNKVQVAFSFFPFSRWMALQRQRLCWSRYKSAEVAIALSQSVHGLASTAQAAITTIQWNCSEFAELHWTYLHCAVVKYFIQQEQGSSYFLSVEIINLPHKMNDRKVVSTVLSSSCIIFAIKQSHIYSLCRIFSSKCERLTTGNKFKWAARYLATASARQPELSSVCKSTRAKMASHWQHHHHPPNGLPPCALIPTKWIPWSAFPNNPPVLKPPQSPHQRSASGSAVPAAAAAAA